MELTFKVFDINTQLEQHRALFAECFPEVYHANPEYAKKYEEIFRHQYQGFPGNITSYQYAAMLGDEMVGFYAILPYKYKINGKLVQAGMVGGVMTSPKYRKMGIFTKLGNYAAGQQKLAGVSYNYTFPIRKAVLPGFIRMGWDIAFELPLYIKFFKFSALLKSKSLGFLAPIANPFLKLFNYLKSPRFNKNFTVKYYTDVKQIQGYPEIYELWYEQSNHALVKDFDFIKWRYGSPNKEYVFVCIYNGQNKMVGFAALNSLIRDGVPSYGIVDMFVIDKASLPSLLHAVFEQAQKDHKEALLAMSSKKTTSKYKLSSYGFLKSPYVFKYIHKNMEKSIPDELLSNEKYWDLMFVDSDDL